MLKVDLTHYAKGEKYSFAKHMRYRDLAIAAGEITKDTPTIPEDFGYVLNRRNPREVQKQTKPESTVIPGSATQQDTKQYKSYRELREMHKGEAELDLDNVVVDIARFIFFGLVSIGMLLIVLFFFISGTFLVVMFLAPDSFIDVLTSPAYFASKAITRQ